MKMNISSRIDDHFLQIMYTDACCGASVVGDSVSYAECNVAISLKQVSTILPDRCECHGSLLMIVKTDAFLIYPSWLGKILSAQ